MAAFVRVAATTGRILDLVYLSPTAEKKRSLSASSMAIGAD